MMKLCLIGHPVKHSKSPIIYDYLCPKFDKVCKYDLIDVSPETFSGEIERIFRNYNGFNITVPYKKRIVEYLDSIQVEGALNFAMKVDNKWVGKNTDIDGFLLAMQYHGIQLKGSRVAIIGAGGAAIAAILACHSAGADITIFNRTLSKAEEVRKQLNIDLDIEPLASYCDGFDLTIQCTSVGLNNKDESPIKGKYSGIGYDMVYGNNQHFLKQFDESYDGASMLVGQALYNFHYWFDLPLDDVFKYFEEVLNEIKA